jgi:hypothetical protein
MLQSFLFAIKDHRRKQGQRYQLGQILFFFSFGDFKQCHFLPKGTGLFSSA